MKKDSIGLLLDQIADCLSEKSYPDRIGYYTLATLNRRKARKVIEEWLKKRKNSSRV